MKQLCLLLGAVLISACGFHRQGIAPMPDAMKVTYIESGDVFTDFQRTLREALKQAGAALTDQGAAATATLRITQDATTRHVLSVSANNTPREYEIVYTVTYSVVADGQELLAPQTLSLTRDYSFNEQTLLAKDEEEEILRRALARDLVGIVMRRLSSL